LAPTGPPAYQVNTRADITGGSGVLEDAFGFIRTHGTLDLQTGVVTLKCGQAQASHAEATGESRSDSAARGLNVRLAH
jgi:hypothetical protein